MSLSQVNKVSVFLFPTTAAFSEKDRKKKGKKTEKTFQLLLVMDASSVDIAAIILIFWEVFLACSVFVFALQKEETKNKKGNKNGGNSGRESEVTSTNRGCISGCLRNSSHRKCLSTLPAWDATNLFHHERMSVTVIAVRGSMSIAVIAVGGGSVIPATPLATLIFFEKRIRVRVVVYSESESKM